MNLKTLPLYVRTIGIALIILIATYFLILFVPFLNFLVYLVLGAGALWGVLVIVSFQEYDRAFNRYINMKDDEPVTFSRKDGKTATLRGKQAKDYFQWLVQYEAQAAFGSSVLAVIYSIVGFMVASLNGLIFWVVLIVILLFNLRSLQVFIIVISWWGKRYIFSPMLEKPSLFYE